MSFAPLTNPPANSRFAAEAREVQALPGLFAQEQSLGRQLRTAQDAVAASRARGIEPPGNVVAAVQVLADAHRALSRSVNAARVAIVPRVQAAAEAGALTGRDLDILADAGILSRRDGRVVIPGGWVAQGLRGLGRLAGLGILPLIPIAICIAIVAVAAAVPLTVFLGHVRQARTDAANATIASNASTAAMGEWAAQAQAARAEVERSNARRPANTPAAPLPPLPPLPNLPQATSGNNAAANAGNLRNLALVGGVLALVGVVAYGLRPRKGR
jgi:hypothetical protein